MRGFLAIVVSLPMLALFGGVGVFAWRAAATWDRELWAALIGSLTFGCGGGLVVLGLLLILGIILPIAYVRSQERQERAMYQAPRARDLGWAQDAPQIEEKSGSWQRIGDGQYDLWESPDEESVQRR